MPEIAYSWAPITKTVREDDGTLLVYGPAASSALDRDHQRLDSDWLDQAMPRWLAEGGGVREQHDPKRAVGVGVGLSKDDDGAHLLTARIVDPVAVKKIEHGVLRGFSVGIKNPKVQMGKAEAPNGLVIDGDVIEVSVVDRPANAGCTFALAKADAAGDLALVEDPQVVEKSEADTFGLLPELYERLAAPVKDALAALAGAGAEVTADATKSDDADSIQPVLVNVTVKAAEPDLAKDYNAADRKRMAASGQARDDGSYPIKSKSDLRKAIRAVGRGNADHNKIRAHIVQRAKALGLESMVPDNWNADGSVKDDAEKADVIAKAEEVLRRVRGVAPELVKADDGEDPADSDGDEAEDISGADQAIAIIAKLIESEAQSLGEGNSNEACDIALLLDAVRALEWFKCREQAEDSDGDEDGGMELADAAKADGKNGGKLAPPFGKKKASADDEPADDEEDDEDEDGKKPTAKKSDDDPTLTKADVADLIKAAVAEANETAEERAKALAADLAKAQQAIEEFRSMPTPGGPVLTRTTAQQAEARKSDADRLRGEARQYMAKADTVEDRDLREGYRDKARALLAKADA